jgi:hypothetical protein
MAQPYGFAAFSTALIRLRQPGPVARNFAGASASSRMLVDTFGSGSRGRPRLTGVASIIARHSGADLSGLSSSNSSAAGCHRVNGRYFIYQNQYDSSLFAREQPAFPPGLPGRDQTASV